MFFFSVTVLLIDYGPLSLKQLSVVSHADAPSAPVPPNTSPPIPPSPPIESPPIPPGAPVPPLPLPQSLVALALCVSHLIIEGQRKS